MKYQTIISAKELSDALHSADLKIIDCRVQFGDTNFGRNAYQTSHIPGAFFAHLEDDLSGEIISGTTGRHPLPSVDKVVSLFEKWGIHKTTQVVIYDNRKGAVAARLWWMLRWLGHENAAVLDGGWQAWKEGNYPLTNEVSVPERSTFEAQVQENWVCNVEEIFQLQKNNNAVLVDSRAANRYRGETEPIDPVAGHIPGAINMPFAENWQENGLLKSAEELRTHFDKLKPNTVFYCGSGVTACYNLLAYAHAGFGNARLYPGSWSEWIVDKNREIG